MTDQGKQPNQGAHDQTNTSKESLKQKGRDTAHEVGEAAQHQAESYFNKQRNNAAEQTHKITSVLQKMADEFDEQEQPYFSKQARKFADTTDRFSHTLRDKDLRSVCNEAKSFSRREPALFLGGVIAAGFLATRFLRSSNQHSQSHSDSHSHSDSADTHSRHSNTTDERSTGHPMQENIPAGQPSTSSQSSSLSGSSSQGTGATGQSGRENGTL